MKIKTLKLDKDGKPVKNKDGDFEFVDIDLTETINKQVDSQVNSVLDAYKQEREKQTKALEAELEKFKNVSRETSENKESNQEKSETTINLKTDNEPKEKKDDKYGDISYGYDVRGRKMLEGVDI